MYFVIDRLAYFQDHRPPKGMGTEILYLKMQTYEMKPMSGIFSVPPLATKLGKLLDMWTSMSTWLQWLDTSPTAGRLLLRLSHEAFLTLTHLMLPKPMLKRQALLNSLPNAVVTQPLMLEGKTSEILHTR